MAWNFSFLIWPDGSASANLARLLFDHLELQIISVHVPLPKTLAAEKRSAPCGLPLLGSRWAKSLETQRHSSLLSAKQLRKLQVGHDPVVTLRAACPTLPDYSPAGLSFEFLVIT